MPKFIVCHRRGTKTQWDTMDVIPKAGELVIEIDENKDQRLHKLKIGDGETPYSELKYLMAGDEIVTQVLAQALPRVVTVELNVNDWEPIDSRPNCYQQTLYLDGITKYSRLDLQPDVNMLAEFQKLNLVFTTENKKNENEDNVIIVYSIGDKPLQTYEMQATIVETEADCDKIVGVPVATPTVNPDWDQTDGTKADFIKNKPMVIKEINKSEIDNLHFNHPDFVEDGIYLVTDDAVPTEYGRNQYFLITATSTDRPYNKERNAIYIGGTCQFRFDYDGRVQKREFRTKLDDNASYVYNWTDWESIGSGGGGIVDQSYDGNSANAQSGLAVAQAIAQLVNDSPEALDTIYELAKALGDDPNFATTIMDMIGKKANESELAEVTRNISEISEKSADHDLRLDGHDSAIWNDIPNEYATKKEVGSIVTEIIFDTSKDEYSWDWINSDESRKSGIFKLVDVHNDSVSISYLISAYQGNMDVYNQLLIHGDQASTSIKYRSYNPVAELTEWYEWATTDSVQPLSAEVTYLRLDVDTLIDEKADKTDLNALDASLKAEIHPTPINTIPTTLEPNKAYEVGTRGTLSLAFPSVASNGDVIYISFLSRDEATNLTVDATNTTDIDLIPEVNTGYEIYAKYNESISRWVVKYSEYSIEGM